MIILFLAIITQSSSEKLTCNPIKLQDKICEIEAPVITLEFEKELVDISKVVFSNSAMTTLPLNISKHFPALKTLTASGLSLTNATANSLEKLEALVELDLSVNSIETIANNPFKDLTALVKLDLHSNDIVAIDEGTLDSLANLKEIDLSNNNLCEGSDVICPLATTFRKNKQLEVINLDENYIKNIAITLFRGLRDLKILKLNNNELIRLPDRLFSDNSALETLDFSSNGITHVGKENIETFRKTKTTLNFEGNTCTQNLLKNHNRDDLLLELEKNVVNNCTVDLADALSELSELNDMLKLSTPK